MSDRPELAVAAAITASDTASPVIDARVAAFIDPELSDEHIVDILIKERCPSFVKHWTWPMVRPVLYGMLGYKKARRWADEIKQLKTGADCFAYLDKALDLSVTTRGLQHVPAKGRSVLVSNHPTGLADGSIALAALTQVRRDIEIMANADACRVNMRFADVIIPVEWVQDKRNVAKTRETLRRAAATFAAERMLVVFPSGALAQWVEGRLVDKPWHQTAVSLARKNRAPVTPLHIKAQNSWLYYRLCDLNKELRDITLFHELLNKQGDRFELTFGPQIPWEHLTGDPAAVTDHLRAYVEDILPNDPDRPYEPLKGAAADAKGD
jgi:putative hemolysin